MSARILAAIVGIVAATVMLLWPAFYNGQAFFFPDTTTYVRGADAAVQRLTGASTPWTLPANAGSQHVRSSVSSIKDKTVLSGRSVYYGMLLYLGELAGSISLSVGIQALLLVLALLATLEALDMRGWRYAVPLIIVVAAFTAAPLYASFLMPDIFSGLTILACGVLLTCNMQGHRAQEAFWFALLAMALTFHTTHVILALAMLGVGALLYIWRRPPAIARGLGAIGAALVAAYICGAAFNLAVTKLVGEPPLTPPFLMARLVDDGPGYRYLVDTCPQNGFIVCKFIDRLPMPSDEFLWLQDPKRGVFASSDPAVRRALSKEQYRFALAVMGHDPWEQIESSARNAAAQLMLLGVPEFDYIEESKTAFADKIPHAYFQVMKHTPAYLGTMPAHSISIVSYVSTASGLACIIFLLVSARGKGTEQLRRVAQLAVLVVFGVIANAVICGTMSGPHDRYQARMAWLIPAMALIAHFAVYRAWWNKLFEFRSRA